MLYLSMFPNTLLWLISSQTTCVTLQFLPSHWQHFETLAKHLYSKGYIFQRLPRGNSFSLPLFGPTDFHWSPRKPNTWVDCWVLFHVTMDISLSKLMAHRCCFCLWVYTLFKKKKVDAYPKHLGNNEDLSWREPFLRIAFQRSSYILRQQLHHQSIFALQILNRSLTEMVHIQLANYAWCMVCILLV